MQPVLPSTMVRGPAALAIIFISSADSHPWQVRWPEVKNSSNGSFLTDLKGSSFCVGSICTKVAMASNILSDALSASAKNLYLFAQSNPLRERLRFACSSLINRLGYFLHVGNRNLAAAQPGDEAQHRRLFADRSRIERGADFSGHHAAHVRRAERIVAINHANSREAAQALGQLFSSKRPEPAQAHKADLLSLLAHMPDGNLHRRRERAHSHQHDVGVFGHVFLEERITIGASKDAREVGIGFFQYAGRALHGGKVLAANFHDPIFIALWGHGDGVIGMEQQIAAVIARQEFVYF